MRFFDVLADDKQFSERWFLGEPQSESGQSIDARLFRYGKVYTGPSPSSVPVQQNGKQIAFNLAAFDMPVVSDEVSAVIKTIVGSECEFFPVRVGATNEEMSILNVIRRIECVDEGRCEVMKWLTSDNRPDRLGCYRSIRGLRIDPARTEGCHVFRIFGWEVSLIVSELIRERLEAIEDLGVVFEPVT